MSKVLTELIRDANRNITPADRHAILDLIEQQAARIAEVEADRDAMMKALAECRDAMPTPEDGAPLEGHWLSAMGDPLEVPGYVKACVSAPVAPAVDAQPVACLICNSTGNSTPCAYPTEINLQQAARIDLLRKEDLSLRALYEDACIQANKNAQDAARWRYAVKHWLDEHIATKQADKAIAALSQHTGEKS